jgi:hypothetical protein
MWYVGREKCFQAENLSFCKYPKAGVNITYEEIMELFHL